MNILNFITVLLYFTKSSNSLDFEFNNLLNKLITTIETVTDFYKENLNDFNVDGIFGLQILQGEITSALSSMETSYMQLLKSPLSTDGMGNENKNIIERLTRLRHEAYILSTKANLHLQSTYPDYYDQMKYFVTNEWMPQVKFRTIRNVNRNVKKDDGIEFNEVMSDECLSEITKYIRNDMTSANSCKISKMCINMLLLQKGLKSYLITHQVLYSVLIQKSNCLYHINDLIRLNNTSIEELQIDMCSRIFKENQRLYNTTSSGTLSNTVMEISVQKQDLYLEQVFICGTIGFMDLLNLTLLPSIMSWVSKSGCFKTEDIIKDNSTFTESRRRLLEELVMPDGCLAHKTSLGLAVLSTYLKLFFNPYIPYVFKKKLNVIKSIKDERIQFQKRNLPQLILDPMSLYDAYIYGKGDVQWEPYFNLNVTVKNLTMIYSKNVDINYFNFIVIVIAVLLTFFVCFKKIKKFIRYLIKK